MKRKIIAFCTAAALLCGMLPTLPEQVRTIVHAAQASGSLSEQLTWDLAADGTLTISGTGAMPDWDYSEIAYYTSEIVWNGEAPPWDGYRSDIRQIQIEEGVEQIGDYAFACCPNLTSITIPASVKTIGEGAVCGGLSLKQVSFASSSSLMTIGQGAFKYCVNLAEIRLPEGMNTLHGTAFDKTALTQLTLPYDLASIPGEPFTGCESLTNFTSYGEHYRSKDGVLYNSDYTTLIRYPNREERFPQIYDDVTVIGPAALSNLDHCQAIILPPAVTKIGDYAMMNCPDLEVVYLPETVAVIGAQVFDFTGLESVYYGAGAAKWATITMGLQGTSVLENASFTNFANACDTALSDGSKICGANAVWTLDEEGRLSVFGSGRLSAWRYGSMIYTSATGTTEVKWVSAPPPWHSRREQIKSIAVYDGITEITDYAFVGCSQLETVSLPDSVTSIGVMAFQYCPKLSQLELGHLTALETINGYAFADTALTEVTLPASLKKLYMSAFDDTAIQKLHIPASVISIRTDALPLSEITVDLGNTVYAADGRGLYTKDKTELLYYAPADGEGTAFLADQVKALSRYSISDAAFETLYLPAGLETIEEYALTSTTIGTVYFGGTQEEWDALTADIGQTAFTDTEVICGAELSVDLNADNVVNASDASLTLMYGASAASGLTFSKMQFIHDKLGFVPLTMDAQGDGTHNADLSEDGNLNAVDSSIMLCYAAAAAAGLPEGESLEAYLTR